MYNGVVEKIQSCLAASKSRLLNKVGRVFLAKSVVSSILVCSMQIHYFHKSVCNKIDSLTIGFITGTNESNYSWSLVNWDIVTWPKHDGGLGIRDSRLTNISLLGKLIWSMLHEESS